MVLPFLLALFSLSSPAQAASIDLRESFGPAKAQGRYRGVCSAFAATGLMEFLVFEKTGTHVSLSDSYNYWAGKEFELDNEELRQAYRGFDGQAGYRAVLAYQFGAMLEKDWPYEAKNWLQTKDPRCEIVNGKPASECFTGRPPEGAPVLPYRIKPAFVERERIGAFLLATGRPVVFNIRWYFNAVDGKGDFRLPTPDEVSACNQGNGCGGHAILLVGYDDSTRKFLFRNSWGADWGSSGYGTLPEEYVVNHCEACAMLPDLPQYDPAHQELLTRAAQGVTGELSAP